MQYFWPGTSRSMHQNRRRIPKSAKDGDADAVPQSHTLGLSPFRTLFFLYAEIIRGLRWYATKITYEFGTISIGTYGIKNGVDNRKSCTECRLSKLI